MYNQKGIPHILLPQSVIRNILRENALTQGKTLDNSKDSPICPRCEGVALRDIGYSENRIGRCPHCGFHGRMDTTVREYIQSGAFK